MENATQTPSAATSTSPQKAQSSTSAATSVETIVDIKDVNFSYDGKKDTLKDISFPMYRNEVTAFIGPSGCGKSTLLRCLNRMNDLIPGASVTKGQINIMDQDIYAPEVDVIELRKQVGMVFQKSNPFPRSIYDNIAYGLRVAGITAPDELDQIVQESLEGAALWEEVKDRLQDNATGLSGGQQQRLCIARTIAVKPKIILMDEPCSALDPIATAKVEDLINQLKSDFTIVIVTHNMQQATRVSDRTAFFYLGELIEYDNTTKLFTSPSKTQTEDYISGRFG
tara:strand:- start:4001 stop:4846 length:846 start_codon:yes stop_codon:yes gene_type:complete